jgi:hypothetical protein
MRGVEDENRRLEATLKEHVEKHKSKIGYMDAQASSSGQQIRLLNEQCARQVAELETLRSKNSQLSHWAQVGI